MAIFHVPVSAFVIGLLPGFDNLTVEIVTINPSTFSHRLRTSDPRHVLNYLHLTKSFGKLPVPADQYKSVWCRVGVLCTGIATGVTYLSCYV